MINKRYSTVLLCAFMLNAQPVKAEMSMANKAITTVVVGALGFGSITTTIQWWNLGSRLDELQMRKKVGTLVERNVWLSPYDFTSGYALWATFTGLGSRKEKDTFRQQLLEEVCRAEGIDRNAPNVHLLVIRALDRSLVTLQNELNDYSSLTPIMLEMARAAGFAKNPQELITSDYIIDYALTTPVASAQRVFSSYMQDFPLPIEVKYTWSSTFGTRIPYCFSWTHKKAAECTFELLQQYARIRSIQRVMEQYVAPSNPSQSINLNLKNR